MRFNKFFFLLSALLLPVTLFSQNELYKPGFIITLQGDTINGQIRFTASQKDNTLCLFKTSDTADPTSYSPSEISGFRFDEGKFFISKKVPVYRDTMLLFVEYLVKGKASFYYLAQNDVDHYYIETENVMSELSERDTVIAVNGEQYREQREKYGDVRSVPYKATPRYYGKLRYIMSDCPQIQSQIAYVELNHKSLIKLGQDYHRLSCADGQCVVFERTVKPVKIFIGPSVGYSMSVFDIADTRDYSMPGIIAGISTKFIYVSPEKERFFFSVDALLHYNKSMSLQRLYDDNSIFIIDYNDTPYYLVYEKEAGQSDGYVEKFTGDIELLSLKIPVQVGISFNLGNNKWNVSPAIGPVLSFAVSQNENYHIDKMVEQFGHTVPSFMFGGACELEMEYKTPMGNYISGAVAADIITSLKKGNYAVGKAKTISVQLGFKF